MGLTLGLSGGSLGFSRKGLFVLCLFLGAFIFSQGCVTVPKEIDPKYGHLKLMHVEEMNAEELAYYLDRSKNDAGESGRWKKAMNEAMKKDIDLPEKHLAFFEKDVLDTLALSSSQMLEEDIETFTLYLSRKSVERKEERLLMVYYQMFSTPSGPIPFLYSREVYLDGLQRMNVDSKSWGDSYPEKLPYVLEASYQYLRLFADNIRDFKKSMGDREMKILRGYRDQVLNNYYGDRDNRHYKNAKAMTRELDPMAYLRVYSEAGN